MYAFYVSTYVFMYVPLHSFEIEKGYYRYQQGRLKVNRLVVLRLEKKKRNKSENKKGKKEFNLQKRSLERKRKIDF